MDIKDIKKAYFIGIKGAGMVGVAQILRSRNIEVSGSDTDEIFYTNAILKRCEIKFYEEFIANHVPQDADLVIYSTAYNEKNNVEIAEAKKLSIPLISYPEILGMLFKEKLGIAVCGTHGKTTTSAILAEVLMTAGLDPSAIVGSQVLSWQGSALAGKGDYFVAEADEYQNKLMFYNPWSVILTSVDWDHPDFFPDFNSYKKVFEDFVQKIPKTGFLVLWGDSTDTIGVASKATCKKVTYGFGEDCDYKIIKQNGSQKFEVSYKEKSLGIFETPLIGKHNVLNAAAVISLCHQMQVDMEKIKKSLAEFKGTSRRFENVGMFKNAILIDDYAHHPEELKALITGVKSLFPKEKLTLVFQPHLFSRTNDLADEFAKSLDLADEIILLPIYPARELPMEGVTSELILDKMNLRAKNSMSKEQLNEWIKINKPALLVMAGAGDIDAMLLPVNQILISN